jgi:hypothetical protein
MLELAMAPARGEEVPTIFVKQSQDCTDLHALERTSSSGAEERA